MVRPEDSRGRRRKRDGVCYRTLLIAGWNICSCSRGGGEDLYARSPLFPLSKAGFVTLFSLTQSGMITALINSWIDMPRSSASVCRSSKLSSRSDSMNFANWTPKERERVGSGFLEYKHSTER